MCEYLFGQCASGLVIFCEYGDVRMIGYVRVNMECASGPVIMCE